MESTASNVGRSSVDASPAASPVDSSDSRKRYVFSWEYFVRRTLASSCCKKKIVSSVSVFCASNSPSHLAFGFFQTGCQTLDPEM